MRKLHKPFLCKVFCISRSSHSLNIKQFIMGVYVVWSEHQAVHYGCLCRLIWTSSSSLWVFMLSDLNIKQFIMGVYVVWSEHQAVHYGCLCCLIWTSSSSLWVFMLSDLNIKQFIMFMLSDLNIKQFIMFMLSDIVCVVFMYKWEIYLIVSTSTALIINKITFISTCISILLSLFILII
jgi:hypothetical protein